MPPVYNMEEVLRGEPPAPAPVDRRIEAFTALWPAGAELDEEQARKVVLEIGGGYPFDYAEQDARLAGLQMQGWLIRTPGGWQRPEVNPAPAGEKKPTVEPTKFITPFGETVQRTVHVMSEEGVRVPFPVWYRVEPYSGPREGYESWKQAQIDNGTPLEPHELNSLGNQPR